MIIEFIFNILKSNTESNNNLNKHSLNANESYKTRLYNNNNINNNKHLIKYLLNKDFYIYFIFLIIIILILTTINLGILIISLNSNKKIIKLLKNINL